MTARSGPGGASTRSSAPGRACDRCRGPVAHQRAPTARSAARATAASSNGTLRPPASSWPCSCPLPAITTTSPGRSAGDGARRSRPGGPRCARRRSRGRAGTPARISSMIAPGSSERGLSEVTIAPSARRAAISPHQRALAAIAIAAAAEDDDHARPRVTPRARLEHARQRVRACARSRRAPRSPVPRRRARTARRAPAAPAAPSHSAASSAPSARAAAIAQSAFSTLNRPGSEVRQDLPAALKVEPLEPRHDVGRAQLRVLAVDSDADRAGEVGRQPPVP